MNVFCEACEGFLYKLAHGWPGGVCPNCGKLHEAKAAAIAEVSAPEAVSEAAPEESSESDKAEEANDSDDSDEPKEAA